MALTISQQIDIINNDVTTQGYKLSEFISQISINEIESFLINKKVFDSNAYPLAQSYLNKINEVSKNIKEKPFRTFNTLVRIMVGIMANTITPAQVAGATTSEWSTFLENNISICFDILGGVYPEEKQEYINI